ncbi:hypothetical protein [Streptomyces sp. A0958]|uniref:hypothetical protein n=1 Tax=Streptomyces sp. A0958 TaxID=2563101 RepID=UPI001F0D85D2|nr:hypothetical protein [Streptomyces sp. A0958]
MTAWPYRRRGRTVQARFLVRELPGITVAAADDGVRGAEGQDSLAEAARRAADDDIREAEDQNSLAEAARRAADDDIREAEDQNSLAGAARRAAERTLAEAGRGYLGGRLELRTHGGTGGARDRRALHHAAGRAAALAVTATLRGDDTGVSVRATRHPR